MPHSQNKSKTPDKQQGIVSNPSGRKRTSMKRRIMQRVIIALIFSAGVIAAQEMGWLGNMARQWSKQKVNWMNNKEVTQHLRQVITDNKLSDTLTNCLVFVIHNDTGGEIVNMQVREQHNSTCTNTRSDFPLLFTFRVDRTNGNIQIDKGSPNHFYPIQ